MDTPFEFVQYANEICKSITLLYMSVDHLLVGPEDFKYAKPIPDTLQVCEAMGVVGVNIRN